MPRCMCRMKRRRGKGKPRFIAAVQGSGAAKSRTMGMPMSALIFAALAAAALPRPISDARIAAIEASPFDRRAMMFRHELLGLNRGMRVVADYPCSDVCPDATVRIIHYD